MVPANRDVTFGDGDDEAGPPRAGWRLSLLWILANAAAWGAGTATAFAIEQSEHTVWAYLIYVFLAFAEAVVLRAFFSAAVVRAWVAATVAGAAAAAAIWLVLVGLNNQGGLSLGVRNAVSSVVDNVVLAFAQWAVLRRVVRLAALWIPATMAIPAVVGVLSARNDAAAGLDVAQVGLVSFSLLALIFGALMALPQAIVLGLVVRRRQEMPAP